MTDKKELRYIKRLGELSRASGLMLGMVEGLLLDFRIPEETRNKAKKILNEARELVGEKGTSK